MAEAVTENGWRVCGADRHILLEFMVVTLRRRNLKFLDLCCAHTNRLLWRMYTLDVECLVLSMTRPAHFSGECQKERWRSRTVNDGKMYQRSLYHKWIYIISVLMSHVTDFPYRKILKQMIFLLFNKSKIGFDVQIMATQKLCFPIL